LVWRIGIATSREGRGGEKMTVKSTIFDFVQRLRADAAGNVLTNSRKKGLKEKDQVNEEFERSITLRQSSVRLVTGSQWKRPASTWGERKKRIRPLRGGTEKLFIGSGLVLYNWLY